MDVVRRWMGPAVLLLVPQVLLVALLVATRLDPRFFSPVAHLMIVSAIAGLAVVIAAIALYAARRSRHPGLVWLGCGSTGMGILMLGHALTTPGVMGRPFTPWVIRFSHVAIAVFAIGLFMCGRRVNSRSARFVSNYGFVAAPVTVGLLAAGTAAVVVEPMRIGATEYEDLALSSLTGVAVVLSLAAVITHWHRWQLGHDRVQLALVLAAAMTVAAALSLEFGRFQRVSWWDYHAYLLVGFALAVYAILQRARKAKAVGDVLESALSDDPFVHIVNGYPEALRQLVKAVEVKDTYTHGHSERTARVAAELGMRLRLPNATLRVIARGAYLHDIGKIGIPEHVLNKPGRLSAEEQKMIRSHPQLGYEIASTASRLEETLGVILHHHERFDGSGYPDGLAGEDLPIEARVVAVADVWDALTSDRAYRQGLTAGEALAHIEAGRGSHFDPQVVDAMIDLAAEWGINRDGSSGNPTDAWEAAQSCHQLDDRAQLVGA